MLYEKNAILDQYFALFGNDTWAIVTMECEQEPACRLRMETPPETMGDSSFEWLSVTLDDAFADFHQINKYFAGIATGPNYDPDQITIIKPIISFKNSGDTTCEYDIYKILSTLKRTSPGIDGVPYWVYKYCAIEFFNTVVNKCTPPSTWLRLYSLPYQRRLHPLISLTSGLYLLHQ